MSRHEDIGSGSISPTPTVKLFLESDGFGYHRMASDLDRDHRRQNLLVLEGWRPLRVTARMSDEEIVATLDAVYDRVLRYVA